MNILILTLKEARELQKPVPYTYILSARQRHLVMFGAAHFKPSGDEQYESMRTLWADFVTSVGAKIALVEPGIGPVSTTFEGAVATNFESGAAAWLALQDGVGLLCADLEFSERLQRLKESFSGDDIAYWVLAREMSNFVRNPAGRSADEVLASHLTRYRRLFNAIGVAGDRAWFEAKHTEMFGAQSTSDIEFWKKINSQLGPEIFIRIIEQESLLRNQHIYSVIKHLWGLGRSIFITYGSTHAIQLEPALRKLVGEE